VFSRESGYLPSSAARGPDRRPGIALPAVLKDDPPEQLIAAIRTAAAGNALLSPAVTKRVIRQFAQLRPPSAPAGFEQLTAREHDVFRLMADGLSNAEIGRELYIGETTVKTHVTRVLQKLELRDRVQAVVLAHQCGLAGPADPGHPA
jgi:DNA-binding NarL/FixJ family response regulator